MKVRTYQGVILVMAAFALTALYNNCSQGFSTQGLGSSGILGEEGSGQADPPGGGTPPIGSTPTNPTPPPAVDPPAAPPVDEQSCSKSEVLCVGVGREYATIQAASNVIKAGDTVLVFSGQYAGFSISKSGTATSRITFLAAKSDVVIASSDSNGNGIHIQNASYITIEGFHIQDSQDKCIAARGGLATSPMRGLTIRNNTAVRCGHEGFYFSQVADSLIEGNSVSESGQDGQNRAHCMYIANAGSDNTTIRKNHLFNCPNAEANGIHFNGDLSVGGDGIISGLVVESNIIHDVGQNGFNGDGIQSSTFQNNIVYRAGKNGFRAYQIDGAQGPKGIRLINNTFYSNAGAGIKFSEDAGGHIVFNNLLVNNAENIVYESSSIQQAANVVSSAPAAVFVNFGAADFHPKAGGPADGAGVPSLGGAAAPAGNIEGLPRGSKLSAGAY